MLTLLSAALVFLFLMMALRFLLGFIIWPLPRSVQTMIVLLATLVILTTTSAWGVLIGMTESALSAGLYAADATLVHLAEPRE